MDTKGVHTEGVNRKRTRNEKSNPHTLTHTHKLDNSANGIEKTKDGKRTCLSGSTRKCVRRKKVKRVGCWNQSKYGLPLKKFMSTFVRILDPLFGTIFHFSLLVRFDTRVHTAQYQKWAAASVFISFVNIRTKIRRKKNNTYQIQTKFDGINFHLFSYGWSCICYSWSVILFAVPSIFRAAYSSCSSHQPSTNYCYWFTYCSLLWVYHYLHFWYGLLFIGATGARSPCFEHFCFPIAAAYAIMPHIRMLMCARC